MCKPIRQVGMGIDDPVLHAPIAFEISQQSTPVLTKAIKTGQGGNLTDYKSSSRNSGNTAEVAL